MNYNIMLIGLGPHSKRIYMNYFKKHQIYPKILVDVESNKDMISLYLNENGFTDTKIWLLPDEFKDLEELPNDYYNNLKEICKIKKITHIISSTEPKAHNMYLKFALENNYNILSDKPITVVKDMYKKENIKKIKSQYKELSLLYDNNKCHCQIMCQRQYHKGYQYVKSLLANIIKEYNIPITYIDIYHCDGNWEMPHDLNKENHPYKYGYGKLFHSGYHFIDLLAEFIKLNKLTTLDKRITKGNIYGSAFFPNDESIVFSEKDYKKIFDRNQVDEIYNKFNELNFDNYGEKNYHGLLNFMNSDNKIMTVANLNLLHYGFSRRGWIKSKDYYKSNGRVRHERINIQVGPLLNVQIHSYQSKEIKDRQNNKNEIETGGLEHFDIDIYRNVDIIGGIPFERIHLRDLYDKEIESNSFIGYNEYSREEFISDFLSGKKNLSDLNDQKLGIEILYSAAKTIYNQRNGISQLESIKIPK